MLHHTARVSVYSRAEVSSEIGRGASGWWPPAWASNPATLWLLQATLGGVAARVLVPSRFTYPPRGSIHRTPLIWTLANRSEFCRWTDGIDEGVFLWAWAGTLRTDGSWLVSAQACASVGAWIRSEGGRVRADASIVRHVAHNECC